MPGQFGRLEQAILYRLDQFYPRRRRQNPLLVLIDILALEQGLYNRRPGGRPPYPVGFHQIAQFLIVHVLARRLHRLEQIALAHVLGRLGLLLDNFRLMRPFLAHLVLRQHVFLVVLLLLFPLLRLGREHHPPAGIGYHLAGSFELYQRVFLLFAFPRRTSFPAFFARCQSGLIAACRNRRLNILRAFPHFRHRTLQAFRSIPLKPGIRIGQPASHSAQVHLRHHRRVGILAIGIKHRDETADYHVKHQFLIPVQRGSRPELTGWNNGMVIGYLIVVKYLATLSQGFLRQ